MPRQDFTMKISEMFSELQGAVSQRTLLELSNL